MLIGCWHRVHVEVQARVKRGLPMTFWGSLAAAAMSADLEAELSSFCGLLPCIYACAPVAEYALDNNALYVKCEQYVATT
jgi:hypothetical protein